MFFSSSRYSDETSSVSSGSMSLSCQLQALRAVIELSDREYLLRQLSLAFSVAFRLRVVSTFLAEDSTLSMKTWLGRELVIFSQGGGPQVLPKFCCSPAP